MLDLMRRLRHLLRPYVGGFAGVQLALLRMSCMTHHAASHAAMLRASAHLDTAQSHLFWSMTPRTFRDGALSRITNHASTGRI